MNAVDETTRYGTIKFMKALKHTCVLATSALILLAAGCSTSSGGDDDGGGANSAPVISGTITVSQESDWDSLKLGLFSGGDTGSYTALGFTDNATDFIASEVRLTHSDDETATDTAISVSPSATLASVPGTGATSRNYSFTLSAPAPVEDQEYFFAAWLDADGDGVLDLVNASLWDYDTHATGEFNRLSWKESVDNDDLPTTLMIHGFLQGVSEEQETLLQPVPGTWKYSGYDANSYNELNNLNTPENKSGFNFTMVPNNGW